jgi:hypothetical protein
MAMFAKRRPPLAHEPLFPVLDPAQVPQIISLINQFQGAPTIAETEGPARGLLALSGASPNDEARSVWVWFTAWATEAQAKEQPFLAVRIAEFIQYYSEMFAPNAGPERMFLHRATDDQRAAIERAAYQACNALDPAMSIRSDFDLTIALFQRYLGERINHPPGSPHGELEYGAHGAASPGPSLDDQITASNLHRTETAPPGVTMSGGPDDDVRRFVIDLRTPGDAEIQVIVQTYLEAANEQDAADRVALAIGERQIRAVQLLAPTLAEHTGSDAWWWDGTSTRPWFGLNDQLPMEGSFRVAWSVFIDAASLDEAVSIAFDRHGPGAPAEHLGFLVVDHHGQIWSIWAGMPWE